jgi:hypothetical protein
MGWRELRATKSNRNHDPASSPVGSALIRAAIDLHIAPEIKRQGLEINQHGEEGYMTSG